MNYLNGNYPYPYNSGQYIQPNQYMQGQQMQQAQPSLINGKFVDGEEVVRATEVPMGGYGIFPKADLSEVYIKTWNNNGTTNITAYRPVTREEQKAEQNDRITEILDRLSAIEAKLSQTRGKKVTSDDQH